jgi:formylglycine-generating enzyme required for sulfatase activity
LSMDCDDESRCQNVLIAGACLEDVGESGLGRVAAQEVTEALLKAARDRSLSPVVQRDAGFSLGRTGWAPPDLDAFIEIPIGPFLYGEEKRKVTIERPFAVGKYPVTNLQYRRFIAAKGYQTRAYWSEDGWAWREGTYDSKADKDTLRYLERRPVEKRHEPFFWHDLKWNNPLAPVVGVSWFEAEAYCNWLTKELGKPMRLPTEEEWERVARHTDGREYPWGNEFDRNCLNVSEWWAADDDMTDYKKWSEWYKAAGQSASTTMVGQFTEGNSAASMSDLSGNVWEWTNSWYDKTQRILRGGSWSGNRRGARCAYRDGFVPVDFHFFVGVRIFSPGS